LQHRRENISIFSDPERGSKTTNLDRNPPGTAGTESTFEDARAGEAENELAWCEQFLDDMGTLDAMPENLRSYFSTEAYLRDMKLGGDVSFESVNGTVYAFWNH